MKPLIITMGEPAGIGAELCLHLLADPALPPLVVLGDRTILAQRAQQFGLPFTATDYVANAPAPVTRAVWHVPAPVAVVAGKPQVENAEYILQQLQLAAAGCQRQEFSALVTAPISKETILAAGIPFVGQTEYLAQCAGVQRTVMLLAAPAMRVALATTHLPLRAVAEALSEESLLAVLTILNSELRRCFNLSAPPRIKVCGLNPHAGEGGYLGDEEQRIIAPAIKQAQQQGMHVEGPYPADTLFATTRLAQADCILAMYHDQGLPAIKLLDFENTINITLGLPFIRTSPDHGVALDIAAAGGANPQSMFTAVHFAAMHQSPCNPHHD
ncbi:MAG: 4-hydroxythreonine-4-phosphate dehydrogenase PdxA [Proteobacteria bacterium]|nr:4-hydroxythreonine-4-phosphate dehydrogenase PdxA [Pseudomonadota bacterium]